MSLSPSLPPFLPFSLPPSLSESEQSSSPRTAVGSDQEDSRAATMGKSQRVCVRVRVKVGCVRVLVRVPEYIHSCVCV